MMPPELRNRPEERGGDSGGLGRAYTDDRAYVFLYTDLESSVNS